MLITLAIIGVVAVLTIPTLVANYQEKGWNTAATVFERKLEESLKVMNTQGTLAGYRTTEAFVNELQKHLKITKVCKNDDLMSCFEDKVMFGAGEAEPEEVEISKIKTAKNFGIKDWDTNVVGMQLNNGTTALVAYNPECRQDPYSNQITGTSCVAILYDTSGFTKPNTSGKDLRAINVTKLGSSCAFEIGGTCYGAPFIPTPHVWKACDNNYGQSTDPDDLAFMNKYNIKCMSSGFGRYHNDYWAGAVVQCGGTDKMPTRTQLAEIANYLYNTDKVNATNDVSDLTLDENKMASLGFQLDADSLLRLWSGEEYSTSDGAYMRGFTKNHTYQGMVVRYFNNNIPSVCIID